MVPKLGQVSSKAHPPGGAWEGVRDANAAAHTSPCPHSLPSNKRGVYSQVSVWEGLCTILENASSGPPELQVLLICLLEVLGRYLGDLPSWMMGLGEQTGLGF